MFGDELTFKECTDILDGLKNCQAPFQCAHGRPSVAPIIELSKLSPKEPESLKKSQKLNFANLNVMSE